MSVYRRDFDKTKCMNFLIKGENVFDKYNEIWDKVSDTIKKKINRELIYNKKYLKLKEKKNQHKRRV